MKVLTHTEFNRIGALLWGPRFKAEAAKALRKGIRTIERYSAGVSNVPPDVRRRLGTECAIRAEELAEVAAEYGGDVGKEILAWIYVIAWSPAGPCKVGVAGNPLQRVRGLQVACPFVLKTHRAFLFSTENAYLIEKALLADLKAHALQGEWVMLSVEETVIALAGAINAARVLPEDEYGGQSRRPHSRGVQNGD